MLYTVYKTGAGSQRTQDWSAGSCCTQCTRQGAVQFCVIVYMSWCTVSLSRTQSSARASPDGAQTDHMAPGDCKRCMASVGDPRARLQTRAINRWRHKICKKVTLSCLLLLFILFSSSPHLLPFWFLCYLYKIFSAILISLLSSHTPPFRTYVCYPSIFSISPLSFAYPTLPLIWISLLIRSSCILICSPSPPQFFLFPLLFLFFPVLGLNVQIMIVFSFSFLLLPLEKISLSRHQGERSPNKLD
jgi:hypothetical protein